MIRFLGLNKNNKYYDYTPLVKKAQWSGGYDQSARKIEVEIIKPRFDKDIDDMVIGLGAELIVTDNDNLIFKGQVIERELTSNDDTFRYYALDKGNALIRNEYTFNFENVTPKQIVEQVAKDFGIKLGDIANPKVNMSPIFIGKNLYEVIMTVYTKASASTGKKYMVLFYDDQLNVIEKGTKTIALKLSEKQNINSANYIESIANMVNKVNIVKDNKIYDSVKNDVDYNYYGPYVGTITFTSSSSEELNDEDMRIEAKKKLQNVEQTATISAYADSSCISGFAINVFDSHTGLNQKFYIDQDLHRFENGKHLVDLTLNYKNIMHEVNSETIIVNTTTTTTEETNNSGATSDARNKIVAKAKEIYQLCADGKAWYSQAYRTIDDTKRVTIKSGTGRGKYGYDCSSLVGCCYNYAGFSFMKGLSCSGGTLQSVARKHNATMWRYTDDKSLSKAKPGDIVMHSNSTVTKSNMGSVRTHHTLIYMGNGDVIHASSPSRGIRYDKNYKFNSGHFFMRISELNNDKIHTDTINNGGSENTGGSKVDGKSYVYKFSQAVVTAYTDYGTGAGGYTCNPGKADICASHSMPYGTKIYIPALKGKANSTGIFTVGDTGMGLFDFDLCTNKWSGKSNHDVYVLSWGTKKVAPSFKYMANLYPSTWKKYRTAFNLYKKMNGKVLYFYKFTTDDKGWNG